MLAICVIILPGCCKFATCAEAKADCRQDIADAAQELGTEAHLEIWICNEWEPCAAECIPGLGADLPKLPM